MPRATRVPAKPGIYRLTIGRWYYYGSSKNLANRRIQHIRELRAQRHRNRILQNAFNKYGEKRVKFKVVERVDHVKDLHVREQKWLDEYHGRPLCANIVRDAGPPPIGPRSSDCRRKISETLRKRGVKPTAHAEARRMEGVAKQRKPVWLRFQSVSDACSRMGVKRGTLQHWLRGSAPWPDGLTGGYA